MRFLRVQKQLSSFVTISCCQLDYFDAFALAPRTPVAVDVRFMTMLLLLLLMTLLLLLQ